MKKTFDKPDIMVLAFKDTTAACGARSRAVNFKSGGMKLTASEKCFSIGTKWSIFNSYSAFDDDDAASYEEDD